MLTDIEDVVPLLEANIELNHVQDVTAVALDWFLWTEGERQRDDAGAGKHHRTLTVFY